MVAHLQLHVLAMVMQVAKGHQLVHSVVVAKMHYQGHILVLFVPNRATLPKQMLLWKILSEQLNKAVLCAQWLGFMTFHPHLYGIIYLDVH